MSPYAILCAGRSTHHYLVREVPLLSFRSPCSRLHRYGVLPRNKSSSHRQLGGGQSQRFSRYTFSYSIEFKNNVTRTYCCHPMLRIAFPLTHSSFRRPSCHRFVWKDLYPKFPFSFHVA